MGNQILGRKPTDFVRGFSEAQVQYVKEKFEILKDAKGLLSKQKFQEAYRCSEQIANKAIKFIDFSGNGQIDQYEFICAVAALSNTSLSRLSQILFQILTDGKDKLDQATLETFTAITLTFNSSVLGEPDPTQKVISATNAKKFKKWDYNSSGSLELQEFTKMCLVDSNYKQWMFNMGFIGRRQLENEEELYDEVDSDLQQEFKRHATQIDPDVDKLRKGVEHRIGEEKLGDFQLDKSAEDKKASARAQWITETGYVGTADKEYDQPPSQSLSLDYAYGFRSYDCRNNLKYNSKGKVVYHTGALGIVLDPKQNRQDFLTTHNDDITCLDINKDIAVTGEIGSTPMVVVWNTEKQDGNIKTEYILSEGLVGSVGNVTISSSRSYIAANCNNEDHNIVIYDLKLLKDSQKDPKSKETGVIAEGKASKSVIVDMKFSTDEKTLIVATARQILFFTFKSKKLQSVRGNFGKHSASVPVSLLPVENLIYSGMVNTAIYVWQKDTCVKTLTGHKATVSALCLREKTSILSGDKDGVIIQWSSKQEIEKSWQLTNEVTRLPRVTALSCFKGNVLVGTRGGDIIQFKLDDKQIDKNSKVLMNGHSQMQLWAMCIHPKNGCFYTGGQDRWLMKWKYAKDKRLDKAVTLSNKIRSIDINPNLNFVAVGYENGVVEFLDAETLAKDPKQNPIVNFKNPDRQVLNLVKFDREGRYLAICYTPPSGMVILYEMTTGKKLGEIKQNGRIIALDFSKDAKVIQLNTSAKEYFAYSLPDLKRIETKQLDKLRDETWHTRTLPMGPGMASILSPGTPESDITCCQVSPGSSASSTVLIGNIYSHLKLYPYPNGSVFNSYKGHSSAVSNLRFSDDEKYVVSIGSEEKSILLWKYDNKVVENVYEKEAEEEEGEQASVDQEQKQRAQQRDRKAKMNDQYDELGIDVGEENSVEEEEGEQAMATNSFKGNIIAPSKYEINEARDNKLPKEQLQIEYVFGIRNNYIADEVRNQCRFTSNYKQIVFPTACLGVKMNLQSRAQSYYKGHMEDIVSFAVDPRREIMATGQMAEKNTSNPRKKIVSIHVWDIASGEMIIKLDGFHTIAVVLLEFSPNSKLLFSCGNDDKNSYAVYAWKTGVILHSGPVSGAKVNGIAWKNEDFATCGNKHVKFWSKNKGTQGQIPGKNEAMFSICSSGSAYITGSGSGKLYNWVGGTSAAPIPGHTGKIHTIRELNNTVYTGADDGLVLAWLTEKSGAITSKSERIFDTRSANLKVQISHQDLGVLSIDLAADGQVLLATTGCDIILLDRDRRKPEIVLSGHSKNELWGLATSWKTDDLFVTGGDDGTVRVWSIPERRQVAKFWIRDRKVRAVDWSKDGQFIAVADNKAEMYLFSLYGTELKPLLKTSFKTQISATKVKKDSWVEELKFSPNSRMIVLGAHGPNILPELIGVEKDSLKTLKNYKRLTFDSALLHADWDTGSEIIGMNTQSYKIVFATASGNQQPTATSCRDTEWATWTRKIGWPVQGIFQGVDFTDVNSVCSDRDNRLLAVGYDDQSIRLFRYPAYIPKQVCKQFHGHSSHVTRVRFNNEYLVSVGGMDKTVIVWNVIGRAGKAARGSSKDMARVEEDEEENDINVVDANVDIPKGAIKEPVEEEPEPEDFEVLEEEGEEFLAIKPWLGAIKQPTYKYPAKGSETLPAVKIDLEYVYGYRTKDCRQNLFYTSKDNAVYHAAAVLIYHNLKQNTQTFMTDHKDDILSMAYHKEKGFVLTGELGPKPLVIMTKDSEVVMRWSAPVTKGVLCIGISPSGKLAACAGMDDNHEVAVIDLKNGGALCKAKGGREVILKVEWVNETEFVTVGIKHYKYWTMEKGSIKAKQSSQRLCFVSLAIKDDLILTGAEKDQLMSWRETSPTEKVVLNPGVQKGGKVDPNDPVSLNSVVEAISIQDNFIAAGCKNHHIFILSRKSIKTIINVYNMAEIQPDSQCPSIRAVDFLDAEGTKMLVGTLASEIYQVTFGSPVYKEGTRKHSKSQVRMQGHYSPNNRWTNEVWGLCVDSKSNKFFTCSDDATVRCWDADKRTMLTIDSLNMGPAKEGKAKPLQKDQKTKDYTDAAKGRAIALSHDRNEIIVGCKNGVIRVFEFSHQANKLEYKLMFRKATQQISDIKTSPGTLVIGSHDNCIYVYDYEKGKIQQRFKALKKHSSYITHMDISRDSANLHSTCGAYELLFWDLNTGKQLTGGATMLRDEQWATWTTTLGWPVQGIWPKCTDGTFYNAVDRSHFTMDGDDQSYYLLATGNDLGKVNIFNFPCVEKGAKMVEGRGHSSHVTSVRWTYDDKYIISTGGEDQCVMQWRITVSRKAGKSKPRKG